MKAVVAILISDKNTFKKNGRDRVTLHNDQGINVRTYDNCKYVCIQHRSISVCKANTNNQKGRN